MTYLGNTMGEGTWQPLVSPEQFEAVQARLADPSRRFKGAGTGRKYLGSSLFYCECGERVRTSSRAYTCVKGCYSRSIKPVDELVLAVVRGRLALPDLRQLLARPEETEKARELAERRKSLQARLTTVEADYDSGLIDARRLAAASGRIKAELEDVARGQGSLIAAGAAAALLTTADPVAAFDSSSLTMQQRIVDALMEVTLRRVPRGINRFDPDSVAFKWRAA